MHSAICCCLFIYNFIPNKLLTTLNEQNVPKVELYEGHSKAAQGGVSVAASPACSVSVIFPPLLSSTTSSSSSSSYFSPHLLSLPPATAAAAATQRWRAAANYCKLSSRKKKTPHHNWEREREREEDSKREVKRGEEGDQRKSERRRVTSGNRNIWFVWKAAVPEDSNLLWHIRCVHLVFRTLVCCICCRALSPARLTPLCLISLWQDCSCCTSLDARTFTRAPTITRHGAAYKSFLQGANWIRQVIHTEEEDKSGCFISPPCSSSSPPGPPESRRLPHSLSLCVSLSPPR